jgi:acetoin utilization deacetylase AcuC-like enzyme
MSRQEIAQQTDRLGHGLRVQATADQGAATPLPSRQTRRELAVRVTFEAHRLAATYLATAYEHVVPHRRRRVTAVAPPPHGAQRPSAQRRA